MSRCASKRDRTGALKRGRWRALRPATRLPPKSREEQMRAARLISAVLLALLLLCPHPARADDYPNRPVTLIVPYPPGGGVDTIARVISQKLSVSLGQQIVI